MSIHKTKSFTLHHPGKRLNQLTTQCHFCEAFDPRVVAHADRPALMGFRAVWDTGATNSVITQAIVDACGLKPMGMTKVMGVSGEHVTEVYLVNIMLPSGLGFPNVRVTRGDLHGFEALVGMDIIGSGDFAITNGPAGTVFTFRTPSIARIDFVEEHNAALMPPTGPQPKPPGPGQSFFGGKRKRRR